MSGRKREPGAELRSESLTIRWTPTEMETLKRIQKELGVTYLSDVPRILALRQADLMKAGSKQIVAE